MKHIFTTAHHIDHGYFVTRRVIGGVFSPYFDKENYADYYAAKLNSEFPGHMREVIQKEIDQFTDYFRPETSPILALRIYEALAREITSKG